MYRKRVPERGSSGVSHRLKGVRRMQKRELARRTIVAVVLLSAAACGDSSSGGSVGDASPPVDASAVGDASGGADGASLANGRGCADGTTSGRVRCASCQGLGCNPCTSIEPGRFCPAQSSCSGGYCQPPPGAASCSRAADCTGGKACNLFASSDNKAVGFCTDPFPANTTPIINCPTPTDLHCDTGICVTRDFQSYQCLSLCGATTDCPSGSCIDLLQLTNNPSFLEGLSLAGLKSCIK
jgi:hypothetical protein